MANVLLRDYNVLLKKELPFSPWVGFGTRQISDNQKARLHGHSDVGGFDRGELLTWDVHRLLLGFVPWTIQKVDPPILGSNTCGHEDCIQQLCRVDGKTPITRRVRIECHYGTRAQQLYMVCVSVRLDCWSDRKS